MWVFVGQQSHELGTHVVQCCLSNLHWAEIWSKILHNGFAFLVYIVRAD